MNHRVPLKDEELGEHLSDNQLLRKDSSARSQQENQLLLIEFKLSSNNKNSSNNNINSECVIFYMIGHLASLAIRKNNNNNNNNNKCVCDVLYDRPFSLPCHRPGRYDHKFFHPYVIICEQFLMFKLYGRPTWALGHVRGAIAHKSYVPSKVLIT
jgi:hypothetical protein